jgi:hypothetical protein
METIEKIKSLVESLTIDANKFYTGNKSAGVRVRKMAQELKSLSQELRVNILEETKTK